MIRNDAVEETEEICRLLVCELLDAFIAVRRNWSHSALALQALLLVAMGRVDTVTSLAAVLDRHVASASRAVTELVDLDLIQRIEDEFDRRVHRLSATTAGHERIWAALAAQRDIWRHISDDDLAPLLRSLRALASARQSIASETEHAVPARKTS